MEQQHEDLWTRALTAGRAQYASIDPSQNHRAKVHDRSQLRERAERAAGRAGAASIRAPQLARIVPTDSPTPEGSAPPREHNGVADSQNTRACSRAALARDGDEKPELADGRISIVHNARAVLVVCVGWHAL